jgi:hypothetical protein
MSLEGIQKAFANYTDSSGAIDSRKIGQDLRGFVDKFVNTVDRVKIVQDLDQPSRDQLLTALINDIKTISNPQELTKFFKAFIDTVGLNTKGLEKIFNLMSDIARGVQGEANTQRSEHFLNKIQVLTSVFNEAVDKALGHKAPMQQVAATGLKDARFEQVRLNINQVAGTEAQAADEIGVGQPLQLKMGNVDIATLEGARKILQAIQKNLTPQQLTMFIDELTTGKITIETFLRLSKEEQLKKKFKTKDKLLARVLESAIEEIKKSGDDKKKKD